MLHFQMNFLLDLRFFLPVQRNVFGSCQLNITDNTDEAQPNPHKKRESEDHPRDKNSPSHLVRPDSSFPSSDKRWIRHQRNRVEGSRGEVRSHRADDDEDQRLSGSRHTKRRLDEEATVKGIGDG